MSESQKIYDYLIVGAGISGSNIGFWLEKNNHSFIIFDGNTHNCSKVACGLYNPVSIKRLRPVWRADELSENALSFYQEFEALIQQNFLDSRNLIRRFSTLNEKKDWFKKRQKESLQNFLSEEITPQEFNDKLISPEGFSEINHSGRVDVKKMMDSFQKYLESKNYFFKETFEYNQLKSINGIWNYKNLKARKVVFCEGVGIKENPFFKYLPIFKNKGEIITIHCPDLKLDRIINGAVFLLPLGEDNYEVGSTYKREFKDLLPTEEAKQNLLQRLQKMISVPFTIINQKVGIRPTTLDRRPFIGEHPNHKNLFVFNGLGSRGVLISPTLVKEFYKYLEFGHELNQEVSLERV